MAQGMPALTPWLAIHWGVERLKIDESRNRPDDAVEEVHASADVESEADAEEEAEAEGRSGPVKQKTPFSAAFGRRLREARLAAGYSLTEVANITGLKRPTIATWENGWALPPIDKLTVIAEMYHCNLQWLITGEQLENWEDAIALMPSELRAKVLLLHAFPQEMGNAILALRELQDPDAIRLTLEIIHLLTQLRREDLEILLRIVQRLTER